MCDSLWPHGQQHASLSCPSLSLGVCLSSCPLSATQSSHPLSPLLPSIFPSIRVFSMSWLCASGRQSIGASASVLPLNIQDWFPLGLTTLTSLLFNGLSRVFSRRQFKSFNSLALSLIYGPTLTSVHDYQKNHWFKDTSMYYKWSVFKFSLGNFLYEMFRLYYYFLKQSLWDVVWIWVLSFMYFPIFLSSL